MQASGNRGKIHMACHEMEKRGAKYRPALSIAAQGEVVAYANGRMIRQAVRDGEEKLVKVVVKAHRRIRRETDVVCPTVA